MRKPSRTASPGVGDPQHHGVADGLHVRAAARRQRLADGAAEALDERGGLLVSVRFGERGEPGDVREYERGGGRRHRVHLTPGPTVNDDALRPDAKEE